MKRLLTLTFLLCTFGNAATISLKEIISKVDENNPMQQAILQESLSKEAQHKADNAANPLTLYGTAAKAKPQMGTDTNEYSVGLSKEIFLGQIKEMNDDIAKLESRATMLEGEKEILSFKNGLKELYHRHCIDRQNALSVKTLYDEFETLYAKKTKAYKVGEISKIELLYLKVEKEKLLTMLKEAKSTSILTKNRLLKLGNLSQHSNRSLSCNDIYPISKTVSLKGEAFSFTNSAYEHRLQSTQKMLTRHSSPLDSMEVSVEHDNELDMKRYLVGISIPLNFTGEKSEMKRLEAMHQSNAIEARHQQYSMERNALLFSLTTELEHKSESVARAKKIIEEYRTELLPLLQKSYTYGESSVTEFILSKQQYHELLQGYYQAQKAYYHTLFALYTLTETKDSL